MNQYYSVSGYNRDAVVPSGKFPVDRDAPIRHFGTYSLSREYDLIFSVPGPNIAGEVAVVVPVGTHSREPHVPGMPALPVPLRTSGPSRSPSAMVSRHGLSLKNS